MKYPSLLAILLLITPLCGFSQDSTQQQVVKLGPRTNIAGTHISITPPDKFILSSKLKGFIHSGSASSLVVNEAEGISWIQACQALTQQSLGNNNVNLITQEDVVLKNGTSGRFFVMRIIVPSNDTTKQDLEFERLMLFAGDYHRTVMVNANYPALLKSLLYATMRESMLSVEIHDSLNAPLPDEK